MRIGVAVPEFVPLLPVIGKEHGPDKVKVEGPI